MLQKIRDRFTGGFALAILALIGIPFAFFGIDYNFIGVGFAAKVNGTEITMPQLENAYQTQLLQLSEQGTIPDEYRPLIRAGVLERLIRDALVAGYLDDQGYRVGDAMITDLIQTVPQFQEDGVFSKDLYYTWLDERALDPNVFEAQQRREMRIAQLQRGIGATAFVTPSEYRRYLNLYGEQRQVSVATFDLLSIGNGIEVGDGEVSAYYDARPDDFMSPESVDFEYIEIRRDLLAEQVELTEDTLAAYYEEVAGRYLQDEQREASHILITFDDDEAAAEEQATAIAARARAGEPFTDLARQYSKDGGTAAQGGSLGRILQSQMPGALGDAIFSMSRGQIEGPVRTVFGFHIVRLEDIVEGGPMPLEQVRGELESELRGQQAEQRYRELERALSDALFDAGSLADMAAATGLEIQSASGFTRIGGTPFGANQAAIDTVFDVRVLQDGEISDVVELDANRSVVIKVTAYHEEARKTLDEVREQIRAIIVSERAQLAAREGAEQLQNALREGTSLGDAAAAAGAELAEPMIIGRQDETMDTRVADAAFRVRKPLPGKARVGTAMTTDGNLAVFLVSAVIPGRPETIPLADRDARKEELAVAAGVADFNAFVTELERRADVVRSEDALEEQDFF